MNLILKTRFGSHLYGTNTPNSDLDYKGVYIAPIEDIILNRVKQTIQHNTKVKKSEGVRNTKDDMDFEVIELRKFIYDALNGQTYALDLLFTPLDFTEQYTDTWKYIVDNRIKLMSKKMEPYIGYCRHQAAKYGLKGSRLGEMMRIVDHLKLYDRDKFLFEAMADFTETEYVKKIKHNVRVNKEWQEQEWWDMIGKKHPMNARVGYVLDGMKQFIDSYGERARLAQKNEGVDWKAISHAYRCMYQLEELADTGNLVFPLKSADHLKVIKSGGVPYSQVQDELPELIKVVSSKVENSTKLSEKPDFNFWDDFIISIYKNAERTSNNSRP